MLICFKVFGHFVFQFLVNYLFSSKLRSKITQQILTNICICLLLLNITFLIGIDKKENDEECFTATIFLHYSVLCLWAWLFVEGCF